MFILRLFRSLSLLMLVSEGVLISAAVTEGDRQPSAKDTPGGEQVVVGKKSIPRPIIKFEDGLLSVRVQDYPLDLVLNEVSRQTQRGFILDPGLDGQLVSVQFEDLPLDEGLRQILKNQDVFYFYGVNLELAEEKSKKRAEDNPEKISKGSPQKQFASLMVVWVYPKGQGQGLQPVPPEKWASTIEIEEWLGDPDPELRARAVEALVERKGQRALQTVLDALWDGDDQVRTRALYGALMAGVELPPASIVDLALKDPSPNVRLLALDMVAGHPEAAKITKMALKDKDLHVRNRAREILLKLERGSQMIEDPKMVPGNEQEGLENP